MVNLPIKAKKRKNPVTKQITTTILIKPAISVIISFLILALIYSSFPSFNVAFAYYCQNNGETTVKCCTGVTLKGPIYRYTWCTICDKTDPPSNCTPRFKEEFKNSVLATPPSSTTACPDGSAPDANGKCPPVTQGPKETTPSSTDPGTTQSQTIGEDKPSVKDNGNSPPSTSQRVFSPTGGCVPFGPTCIPCDPGLPGGDCIPSGDWRPSSNAPGGDSATPPNVPPPAQGGAIEQPPSNVAPPPSPSSSDNPASNNNLPTPDHNKPKGSDLGQLVGGGGESASKKGSSSNNDNSPTPPACPDKGPIPPNCTLKPKF